MHGEAQHSHPGHRLRELRRLAGCTQADVQRLTGISFNRISMAECGHLELAAREYSAVERVLLALVRERAARLAEVTTEAGAVTTATTE